MLFTGARPVHGMERYWNVSPALGTPFHGLTLGRSPKELCVVWTIRIVLKLPFTAAADAVAAGTRPTAAKATAVETSRRGMLRVTIDPPPLGTLWAATYPPAAGRCAGRSCRVRSGACDAWVLRRCSPRGDSRSREAPSRSPARRPTT